MAIGLTVDWDSKVIFIPRAGLQVTQTTPTEIRTLDLNAFRLELKAVEASIAGMPFLKTHKHVQPVTVGGVTLARVVEIINEYTITFEDGQYAVNLVGANSNVGDRVNVNQVSVRSSNSAGLTFSDAINSQSFINGKIYIDSVEGLDGTVFPQGTPQAYVRTFRDANLIDSQQNLRSFFFRNLLLIPPDIDITSRSFEGNNPVADTIVLQGSDSTGSNFKTSSIGGLVNGPIFIDECIVGDTYNFSGGITRSVFAGIIQLKEDNPSFISILQSGSNIAGTVVPVIDANNTTADLSLRDYSGGLELRNLTQGNSVSVDFMAGTIILDDSNTNATLVVRGSGKIISKTTGECLKTGVWNGVTIINDTSGPDNITHKVWSYNRNA